MGSAVQLDNQGTADMTTSTSLEVTDDSSPVLPLTVDCLWVPYDVSVNSPSKTNSI